ncbi:MAG: MerR family transcriptional regulator [Chitinivibrionales bacterium]|nr:MerR family transcriptional regulator [Chitinivibrionales bacterium]
METALNQTASKGLCIGDVAKICGVPAHTIRFWEREFAAQLMPDRTNGKQRRYQDGDISQIMRIKNLLWEDKFSIEGARKLLNGTQLLPFVAPQFRRNVSDIHDLAAKIVNLIQQNLSAPAASEKAA